MNNNIIDLFDYCMRTLKRTRDKRIINCFAYMWQYELEKQYNMKIKKKKYKRKDKNFNLS